MENTTTKTYTTKTLKNNNNNNKDQKILIILKALKQASQDLQKNPNPNSHSIKPLLELQHESETILSHDSNLFALATHLTQLKTLTYNKRITTSFVSRRLNSREIARVAGIIVYEIQKWIDREFIDSFTRTLRCAYNYDGCVLVDLIEQFEERVSKGFDRELQDVILRSKVFNLLEKVLCGKGYSSRVRETCGFAIAELVKFNKDVFVGQVLMSKTVHELISLGSHRSVQILCNLIKLIKSPVVDELESNDEIPRIIRLLSSGHDFSLRAMALECVLEIAYFGRKEVIDTMLENDVVKKLVELQKCERGEMYSFESCVARFSVQLEVGEGLRQREKRELKAEILKRVRDCHVCEAETATIVAEVLWGASP